MMRAKLILRRISVWGVVLALALTFPQATFAQTLSQPVTGPSTASLANISSEITLMEFKGDVHITRMGEKKSQKASVGDLLNPEDKIYFLDASHPHHNNKSSYGWIPKGEERWIKTNTGRKRVNINGALNLDGLTGPTVITRLEETINADAMLLLIKNIEEHQPKGEIYLILDNARYNHAIKVKSYVKQLRRVHLIFLPSYSPNLNIIERLWLFFHQKILYDKYYETFPEFKEAVLSFFANIDIYRKELRSRLTDSFQVIPA